MEEQFLDLKNSALSLILDTESLTELEEIRIQFLGKNGELTLLFKEVTKLSAEEKPEAGKVANEVKRIIENTIKQKSDELTKKGKSKHQSLDVTEPGIKPPLGHLHLDTQAIREITTIFGHIGFTRERYPEVE